MIWLRSLAFAVWFYGLTVAMLTASVPLRLAPGGVALAYGRLWTRLILGGLRVLCGVSWQVTGMEHVPATGPALIASMHQSAFDTFVWIILRRDFAYVLKQELTRLPLFGAMLRKTGQIAIDRKAGAAALRGLLRETEQAAGEGKLIVIFPEGTRTAPGVRARLQPGIAAMAARTGLPVIPVVTDSGLHWGRHRLRKFPGTIHVAIQPPLPAGLPRDALLAQLASVYAEGSARLGVPVDKSVGEAAGRLR